MKKIQKKTLRLSKIEDGLISNSSQYMRQKSEITILSEQMWGWDDVTFPFNLLVVQVEIYELIEQ